MGSDFDEKYDSLLKNLDEGIAFLRRWNKTHWADWLAKDADRIRRGDAFGLDHLLSAFGGMGSLNDLVIHRVNGDDVADEDAMAVNQRLRDLNARIWHHAQAVRHEVREQ